MTINLKCMTPRIYADFHNGDESKRLRLNLRGTEDDLSRLELALVDGMKLVLSDGELEVEGKARFSSKEKIWIAEIDWNAVRNVS